MVEYERVNGQTIAEAVKTFRKIPQNDFPSDGLVVTMDDIAYGQSLGRTAKFPEMPLPLNGRMKWQKPLCWKLNGVLPEQV